MKVCQTISETKTLLNQLRQGNKTVGFVPTMGALHQGHISLIGQARLHSDLVVCSIFVNPIQFNNPEDLKKYPRTEENDLAMLLNSGCDLVFMPTVGEMYPGPETTIYHFGQLDKVMEGAFRPGHFNGVAVVVKKLFDIVNPDYAYFGEKDFQQLAIIKSLVKQLHLPVTIVACPTLREPSGLAMSSRNMRLSEKEKALAANIYRILSEAQRMTSLLTPKEITHWVTAQVNDYKEMTLEYFNLVDSETLQPVDHWKPDNPARGCIAVHVAGVRLIDNVEFQPANPF